MKVLVNSSGKAIVSNSKAFTVEESGGGGDPTAVAHTPVIALNENQASAEIFNGAILSTDNIGTYFTVTNSAYYFSGNEYTWTSNNVHVDSSTAQSTWTAKSNLTIRQLKWSVSSELNYDKFTLIAAGTTLVNGVSGEESGTLSFDLTAGQSIVMKYVKDSSSYEYSDVAQVTDIIVQI